MHCRPENVKADREDKSNFNYIRFFCSFIWTIRLARLARSRLEEMG